MNKKKMYPVQGEAYYGIFPGRDVHKLPVIGFVGYDEIVLTHFDRNGNYLEHSVIGWSKPEVEAKDDTFEASCQRDEEEFKLIKEKLLECGFTSFETVNVEQFWVDGYPIGITQYPAHLEEVLELNQKQFAGKDTRCLPEYNQICLQPDFNMDEEEYEELKEMLEDWEKSGDFVLYHGNDYYCDSSGEIHSS
jgi:hypothetical protein